MISQKELEVLEKVSCLLSRQELNYLLDPFNTREARQFIRKLGKALGIDTQPNKATATISFYEVSSLDSGNPETVIIHKRNHYPTTGSNVPGGYQERNKGTINRMFRLGYIDIGTYKELYKKLS